jgi:hypothetical protein
MIQTFLEHHSPSSLNLFAACPSMWVLEKVLGRRQPVGAPAHRGTAVEHGVTFGLEEPDRSEEQCASVALSRYDSLMALSGDPRSSSYRRDIPEMTGQALAMLRGYGSPSKVQGYVEWRPEGLMLPVIGYFDYEWADHGIIVDLKTTERMPGEIKRSHARQVATYCTSDNDDARLCYVTPKKIECWHLENIAEHRAALVAIARRVEKFLSLSDDLQFYIDITVPDLESFYWNTPEARQLAYEYWKI